MAKDMHTKPSTIGYETVPSTPSTPTSAGKPDDSQYWPEIASKDEIPGWLRDNDYIVHGHPMPTYSYRRSFRLWRCLHMETMNIWTHLIGSAGFVAAGIGLYRSSVDMSRPLGTGDKFAFGTSITAAAVCFGLSTTFHTLRSHSYNIHHFWGKLDILGICVLALGGGISATYYAFYCNPKVQRIYWSLNAVSAAAAAVTLFDTGGGGSKMRALRGGVFGLLAVAAMLPIFHSVGALGWTQACKQIGVQWYLAEGLSLLLGVGLFVSRVPERLSPGSFDVWGHSHQIFHTCAVVGTAFHVVALSEAYKYRTVLPEC
ncbi:hemolysin-III-like protein 4 [Elsinoe fawcettii]|nr:hemolysin-III-like protein 4 [Elsinoe fawcettii]